MAKRKRVSIEPIKVKPFSEAQPLTFKFTGRIRPKKNGKQIAFNRKTNRPFLRSSDTYKAFERETLIAMLSQRNEYERNLKGFLPINEPVKLTIYLSLSNTQNEIDLSNAIEGPQDILQAAGILANDKLILQINAQKQINRDEPDSWMIKLEPLP